MVENSLNEKELERAKISLQNWLDVQAPEEELKRIVSEQKECLEEDLKRWNVKGKDKLIERLKIEMVALYSTLDYSKKRKGTEGSPETKPVSTEKKRMVSHALGALTSEIERMPDSKEREKEILNLIQQYITKRFGVSLSIEEIKVCCKSPDLANIL